MHGFAHMPTDSFNRTPVPSTIRCFSVLHVDGEKPTSFIVTYPERLVKARRLPRPYENGAVIKIVPFAPVLDVVPVKGVIVTDDVDGSACT